MILEWPVVVKSMPPDYINSPVRSQATVAPFAGLTQALRRADCILPPEKLNGYKRLRSRVMAAQIP
jgi:hypothetical protein